MNMRITWKELGQVNPLLVRREVSRQSRDDTEVHAVRRVRRAV
jgi:hypothetical protein